MSARVATAETLERKTLRRMSAGRSGPASSFLFNQRPWNAILALLLLVILSVLFGFTSTSIGIYRSVSSSSFFGTLRI